MAAAAQDSAIDSNSRCNALELRLYRISRGAAVGSEWTQMGLSPAVRAVLSGLSPDSGAVFRIFRTFMGRMSALFGDLFWPVAGIRRALRNR